MMRVYRPGSSALAHADRLVSAGVSPRGKGLRPVEPPPNEHPGTLQLGGSDRSDASNVPVFRSILFPAGWEMERAEREEQPACFVDLNLDQVVAAIVAKRNEDVLRPIFYSTYRSEQIVRYRQAVFADLERAEVLEAFPIFCETMRAVRVNLDYADRISYKRHRHMVVLRAIHLYCEGVRSLLQSLEARKLRSVGLRDLRRYLSDYIKSDTFCQLAMEARRLREVLFSLSYETLFRSDKVMVRKYGSEPDYTVTVLERFARFRETNLAPPAQQRPKDDFSLNHIEEGILEFVGRLFSKDFRALDNYVAQHSTFIDEVVATFDREIGFFIAYLTFIERIRREGLPFCYPEVSALSKDIAASGSFDLALAAKLVPENNQVICNDFFLRDQERLIVVSGPNQGGKTTFARMFGQLHFLAGLGCPVPGWQARLFLPDQIFTHFEREEDITNLRGKLEDDLVRLHHTGQVMTSDSVFVLNEIFNSTSLEDQVFLSIKVVQQMLETDAIGVCVTFIDTLSTLSDKTVSMMSTVVPDDPAQRTFKLVRRPADGLAYALSLAQKHGVTYERLRTRVRP
jgi:DNA mismatch repair protein MutS